MIRFENIKNKNIDGFVEWLDEYYASDEAPWWTWWDNNYCKKCEPVMAYVPEFGDECECAWCEANDDKCKYFQDMDKMPSNKQIIKMWLMSECEEE